MLEIEITDLGGVGVIRDQEGNWLPPSAFTTAMNMRSVGDGMERIGGQAQVFGTPTVAPHFAIPVYSASAVFWLYVSLTKAYVYDGTNHTNITRALGDYTAANTRDWNGTLFGGVPILNNGADDPQYWSALNVGTALIKLAHWPANTKAALIRAFGPYLFAFNLTESGTNYPHVVRWSHPADPGTVPTSWDYTDPTLDAGRIELPDVNAGIILEALTLRGNLYIYKENSTWRSTLIGGDNIFKFDTFLESSGILAPRCVTLTGDGTRHVVATQDDIIVHNGASMDSILTSRYKKYLANNVDTDNYLNTFMFTNPYRDEAVFCYPEPGFTQPNRALIWNYKRGEKGVFTEAQVNFRNATMGRVETASAETWADGTSTWADADGSWSQLSRRRVVVCGTDDTKFYGYDDTSETNAGTPFTGTLQREHIALAGRKLNGEWIVDFEKRKMITRLWIRATGGPISVRIGFAEQMNGTISWSATQTFDPTTQHYLDFFGSGRTVSIEFSANTSFKILSYKLVGDLVGDFM